MSRRSPKVLKERNSGPQGQAVGDTSTHRVSHVADGFIPPGAHTCTHMHTHAHTGHLRGGLGHPLVLAALALLLCPGSKEEKKGMRLAF